MDFFQRQDDARRRTRILVFYFAMAVACIVLAVYLVVGFAFGARQPSQLWNPELFLWASAGTLAVVSIGSLVKTAQLAKGGGSVASMLGGRLLDPHTTDLDERRLLNVVEEIAIASGVPVPDIYVLEEEESINAFAAGYSPGDAAVGVTRGCMRLLNRDELQGVIAHEFSHILNGDMRLNIRLIGLLSGILALAVIGRMLLHSGSRSARYSRRDSKGGGGAILLLGLGLLLVGSIGIFFGKLIKSAISRQREFLADAAAVQFTRNPAGLAGALKKIGGLGHGSQIQSPNAEEASHLFFGNAMGKSIFEWFSTHPPLEQRIRALDPTFDGTFPALAAAGKPGRKLPAHRDLATQLAPPVPASPSLGLDRPIPVTAPPVLASIGQPAPEHLSYASSILSRIPEALHAAAHEPLGSCALVYSLLLSPDHEARTEQIQELQKITGPDVFQEISRLVPLTRELEAQAKLPLIGLALPVLRQLTPAQYQDFKRNVRMIVESDRQIDLFEYALERMIRRHLEPHFNRIPPTVPQFYSLRPVSRDCAVLLSALAHLGQMDEAGKRAAFRSGIAVLGPDAEEIPFLEFHQCNLPEIDQALNRLAQVSLPLKRRLLEALVRTVLADQAVQVREAELLRAIADSFECPLPPLLGLELPDVV